MEGSSSCGFEEILSTWTKIVVKQEKRLCISLSPACSQVKCGEPLNWVEENMRMLAVLESRRQKRLGQGRNRVGSGETDGAAEPVYGSGDLHESQTMASRNGDGRGRGRRCLRSGQGSQNSADGSTVKCGDGGASTLWGRIVVVVVWMEDGWWGGAW
ncbi:hypothetical protein DM860_002689 [Cuscuta australis]|uniref:Uncharacterized protein n=1 Tax=Cuscuta australis TaxID=267555 RepID=A0A328D2S9_9ASTE|nr:hypothetical protein DM860_002689 [Cuscuta australis]